VDAQIVVPPVVIVALLSVRCAFLLYRAYKHRTLAVVALLLPRLFLLAIYVWIGVYEPVGDEARRWVRWGVLVWTLSEVINDIAYSVATERSPEP
jgi:hypothetical protein